MVGGRNYHVSQFNLATQGERQPGSAFKPFVLAAALKAGISPATTLDSAPGDDRCRRPALEREQLRAREPRPDRPLEGDRLLRQHRLRPAHEHRRPARTSLRPQRRWGSRRPLQPLLLDRPRLRACDATRDGPCLRDARRRRLPARQLAVRQPADRDPKRRGLEQATSSTTRRSRSRSSGSRTATRRSRIRCSRASSSTAPASRRSSPTGRSPARRGRPRTSVTRGSSASRPTS